MMDEQPSTRNQSGQEKEPDPEQILKVLEMQLEFARKSRSEQQGSKNKLLMAMIILFVMGGVSLYALMWFYKFTSANRNIQPLLPGQATEVTAESKH